MRKQDPAEIETEKIIAEIEKRIRVEYEQARREISEKLLDYYRRFDKKDEQWRKWKDQGKKTKDEYYDWKMGQYAIGRRWNELRESIAQDLLNANKIARSIAAGYRPEVYAINHNYATFQVERDSLIDTSYSLYSREAVERIFRDNPQMLPDPGKKVSAEIAENEALRWNNQHIQSVAMQAILQGNSIPDIATRLANAVCDSDRKAATRNARTMMTAVQNAGRLDAYRRASEMGIENQKEWIATLDGRTRHAHRELDGETMPLDEPFVNELGEIMFPGDTDASPGNVWNCRCTLASKVKGWDDIAGAHRTGNLEGQTYEQWKEDRAERSNPILLPEQKADNIRAGFIREYRESDGWVGSGFKRDLDVDAARADRSILVELERSGIKKNPVSMMESPLSSVDAANKVGGGDMTIGSCASLAYSYVGNRNGYDVRDFRGGASAKFFADPDHTEKIMQMDGVISQGQWTYSPLLSARMIAVDNVEAGKEYILFAGHHAAVIRQGEKAYTYQYLELQNPDPARNTWRELTDSALKNRFRCEDTTTKQDWVGIIETSSLAGSGDFGDMLGYINTVPGKEKMGASGGEK